MAIKTRVTIFAMSSQGFEHTTFKYLILRADYWVSSSLNKKFIKENQTHYKKIIMHPNS